MVLDEEALEGMLRRQRESDGDEETPKAELTDQTEEFEVYERPRSDEDEEDAVPRPPSPGAPDIVAPEEEFEELPGRSDDGAPTDPPTPPTEETADPRRPETLAPEADPSEDLGWEAESGAPEADPMEDIGWEIPGTADEAAPDATAGPPSAPQEPTPSTADPALGFPTSRTADPTAFDASGDAGDRSEPTHAASGETVQEPPPEKPPEPSAEESPRRPRVWPPIQGRSHAPTTASEAPGTADAPPQATDALQDSGQASPQTGGEARTGLGGQGLDAGGASGCRLAIIQATFNAEVTDRMAALAAEEADAAGCDVTHLQVPGVFDLPLAAQQMARRDDVDAMVVLGAVVQGETQHDLVITQATATSLHRVALDSGKPIGFGVTGPGMTWEEAEARIGNAKHAVQAAVGQWATLRQV